MVTLLLCYLNTRQVDDLQFQLEEQNVISGDQLETVAESSTNQLTVIQRQLEEEKALNSQLQEQVQVRAL